MFTGIIETLGKIHSIVKEGDNLHYTVQTNLATELKIDQSVAHNGVCLTVVALENNQYTVTAIKETLDKTNLQYLKEGASVNLERAMVSGARLDGHMVQGHVDDTATLLSVLEENGSWRYTFQYHPTPEHVLVDKGSVCINGVSLTVISPIDNIFNVAIIPYTYENTTFHHLKVGDKVNIEFDIIGKYIAKYAQAYLQNIKVG